MAELKARDASGDETIQVGDTVLIEGFGFEPDSEVVLTIPEAGVTTKIKTDPTGFFSTGVYPTRATALLTVTGNPNNNETITIGNITYKWVQSAVKNPYEVRIVSNNVSACLDNLKAVINGDPVHPLVTAGKKTNATLELYANTGGVAGNSIASTDTMLNGSFTNPTFTGGSEGTAIPGAWTPVNPGGYNPSATDGKNTASTHLVVFTS